MPLRLAYAVAKWCGFLLYLLDGRHRRRAIQHLMHAGVATTTADAARIAKLNFEHLAKVTVETAKFDQLFTPENIEQRVTLLPSDGFREALRDSRGTVLVSAHYGNWELTGLYGAAVLRPMLSVMRPFDNPKINELIVKRRSSFRQRVCEKQGALKQLLMTLRKGEAVAMLSDQHAGHLEGVTTTFFGHPACTHGSPASIHLKTGAPLVLGVSRRVDDSPRFVIITRGPYTIEPTGDKLKDIQTLTQMFTTDIEKIIAECPEQWLWSHRRWLDINRKSSSKTEQAPNTEHRTLNTEH